MKQPKMSMSLDRLFFFWRKGDSLLIEKREQDLFERMKNCIGCTYISDLCNQRAQTDGFAEQNGRDAERADLTCRY